MTDINKKKTLVTGAGMGMGKLLALGFCKEGAQLVLVDINKETLEKVAEECRKTGATVHSFVCDLSKRENILKLKEQVAKEVGDIDILVNNAGVVTGGPYEEVSPESDDLMMDVNAKAVHWMTKIFMADLKRSNRGHIVQLASASGYIGLPNGIVYAATKWFVIGLSEGIRLELAQEGFDNIHVTVVCPSFVDTGMFDGVKAPILTPFLKPATIVRKIMEGIKSNQVYVREPFMIKTLPLIRGTLPMGLFDKVADTFGLSKAMTTWKGR